MGSLRVGNLRSLSYSGTTWINLVLASHETALALGPPDRIWKLPRDEADRACLIHAERCPFWPEFIRGHDRSTNFLLQLAEYSGKSLFVLNNPSPAFADEVLSHADVNVRFIKIVRDGRANLHSLMRHHPERYLCVYDAARDWLRPALERLQRQVPADPRRAIALQYEELVSDPKNALSRIGAFLGVEYAPNALRYWEFSQHLVAGNSGVIDLVQRLQGGEGFEHRQRQTYDGFLDQTRAQPDRPVLDDSWRDALGPLDLLAYDYVLGDLHESLGYQRDRFQTDEVLEFLRANDLPLERDRAPNALFRIQRSAPTLSGSLGARLRRALHRLSGSS